ncbi:L-arabinose isomerase [Pluralibacter gergoviae]|nr:L-arabinose isomerase [Pluralibacter gergoviae]
MTIFDNYEVWFVIGSQHLYGPETLRQVTQHAEHVVNAMNAEVKLPCKLVLKPLGTTPDEITHICPRRPTTTRSAPGWWSGCTPSHRPKCGSTA